MYLRYGAGVALLLAIFNALAYKTRGPRAFAMSAAALGLAGFMILYSNGASMLALVGVGGLIVALLGVDLALRQPREKRR
ncbi:MAG: hypothetical protein JSS72_05390 [Armatimonadetes bacterium]|nr:hypothetical protein [Armatimonadota bacterium]